jgi:Icc protein
MKRGALRSALLLVAPAAAVACLRPSQDRAERDLEVGRAEAAGLLVEVAEGLAAVRDLSSGYLSLWAGAPSLDITLRRDAAAPADWQLELRNCMPDAQLAAPIGVQVAPLPRSVPTACAWDLQLPAGQSVRVSIRAPGADQPAAFRFAVTSDVQDAMDRVGEVFDRMNQDPGLRFVLSTGDLTEQGGREEFERFQDELRRLDVPFFTTLGNHELGRSPTPFHDYFGRGNFHFAFQGVHFTLLDSASACLDPLVYDWLDDWLARARSRTHVVAMHVPPLDPVGLRNGGFASRNEAALLLGKLAGGEVDLTLYGHLHSYYRFQNAGIEAHISGGAGALPERFDGIGRHYLRVEVAADAGVLSAHVVRVD